MEIDSILKVIVLITIIVELIFLTHHAKLDHKVDEHMKALDEHIVQSNTYLVD